VIQVRTLTDGGQRPAEIAQLLASFLERARRTLEIAIYDVNLDDDTEALVLGTLRAAAERGVRVRLLYNLDRRPPGVPAPPPPKTRAEEIAALPFATVGVPGWPDLMHHKYVVRDGETVWTGSANWTDDSWTRQENVIVIAESERLAADFTADFEQLWSNGIVEESGFVDPNPVRIEGRNVRAWFTPGFGEALSRRIAKRIRRAQRRVRICSPVLTVAPVLSALSERISDGLDIAGCLDRPQIEGVIYQWGIDGNAAWKLPLLRQALKADFSAKQSTPWGQGTVHDFMHAKITVVDDVAFAGSFNLSRSGEQNAENVLELEDPALADRLAAFIDEVRARYPRFTPT